MNCVTFNLFFLVDSRCRMKYLKEGGRHKFPPEILVHIGKSCVLCVKIFEGYRGGKLYVNTHTGLTSTNRRATVFKITNL
jgi:hypothetical protein